MSYDFTDKFIVNLDLQTTGIDFNKDEIIHISLSVIKNDKNVFELNQYIDPENDELQFQEGLKHNQINWSDVKQAPPFIELAPKVLKILNSANYIVGYNIDFELKFLQKALIKQGGVKMADLKFLRVPTLDPFKFWIEKDQKSVVNAMKQFLNQEIEKTDFANINNSQFDLTKAILNHFNSDVNEMLEITNEKPLGWNGLVRLNNNTNLLEFAIGKHAGKIVDDVAVSDRGYLEWVVNKSDFDPITKTIVQTKLK